MLGVTKSLATHSGQLERWLSKELVEQISKSMKDWYGPPIPVAGVPGKVFAHKGGDFRGRIMTGREATALDTLESFGRRVSRGFRHAAKKATTQAPTGFASLGDLIAEATAGKKQDLTFNKTGTAKVISRCNQLWQVGAHPAIGAAGAAAPGGTVPTSATTGALFLNNAAVVGDTNHFVSGWVRADFVNSLLLYDRIFAVAKTMNSSATEAVTGVPTRYTNTTGGTKDSAEGNFLFMVTGLTPLAATAHNWTVCTYTDQSGNTGATLPSVTGVAGGPIHQFDMPLGSWFAPLATGDTGVKALTQMQCSALVATGLLDFVIGHPIAFMPIPIVNMMCVVDGINTAFNLTQVFDNACLSFIELMAPAANATTYAGQVTIVSG